MTKRLRAAILFLIPLFVILGWSATPARAAPAPSSPLLVATHEAPPFAIRNPDGSWSGLAIDLWSDIAKDQGVSRQDLIDALVKAGEARLDEEKKALPDQVAKLVDATPPTRGPDGDGPGGGLPGRPGNGGPGMPGMPGGHMAPLDPAAKALGMSVDDLRAALKDGKTLAQVAKDKGVDPQKVIDALVAEAKTHLDQAVTDGHLTKDQAAKALDAAKTGITSWVNDGMPAFGPMGGGVTMGMLLCVPMMIVGLTYIVLAATGRTRPRHPVEAPASEEARKAPVEA